MEASVFKAKFAEKHISLTDDWLQQCLAWISDKFNNLSVSEVESKIYEEWLALDLREVGLRILPPNLADKKLIILHEPIHLQMMSVVDIAKSKYTQLKNLQGKFDADLDDDKEYDNNCKSTRILQLTLTDGVQEVFGIEILPVQCLNVNLSPGVKIFLKPPIEIRRGQIMLEPKMVEIRGGDVDKIQETYCTLNILLKALNLPLDSVKQNNRSMQVVAPVNGSNTALPIQSESNIINEDDFDQLMSDSFFNEQLNAQQEAPAPLVDEHSFTAPSSSSWMTSTNLKNRATASHQESNPVNITPVVISPPKPKVLSIAKLNKLRPNCTKGKFLVQGRIERIVEKLTAEDNIYSMKVVLADKTGEITVLLSHDVLLELIELAPALFNEMHRAVLAGKKTMAEVKMKSSLEKLSKKFNRSNVKHFILIDKSQEFPTVIEIQ